MTATTDTSPLVSALDVPGYDLQPGYEDGAGSSQCSSTTTTTRARREASSADHRLT